MNIMIINETFRETVFEIEHGTTVQQRYVDDQGIAFLTIISLHMVIGALLRVFTTTNPHENTNLRDKEGGRTRGEEGKR